MQGKIKSFIDTAALYALPIIIVLVALASFGLGRLSVETSAEKSTIEQIAFAPPVYSSGMVAAEAVKTELPTGSLVASVNGTKYHYPWCSGAQRIKDENKIWFTDKSDARANGYEPAANCKGLD